MWYEYSLKLLNVLFKIHDSPEKPIQPSQLLHAGSFPAQHVVE